MMYVPVELKKKFCRIGDCWNCLWYFWNTRTVLEACWKRYQQSWGFFKVSVLYISRGFWVHCSSVAWSSSLSLLQEEEEEKVFWKKWIYFFPEGFSVWRERESEWAVFFEVSFFIVCLCQFVKVNKYFLDYFSKVPIIF